MLRPGLGLRKSGNEQKDKQVHKGTNTIDSQIFLQKQVQSSRFASVEKMTDSTPAGGYRG
jgi:hypothetical protein